MPDLTPNIHVKSNGAMRCTWTPDLQIRKGFFAVILKDPQGKTLARIQQSTGTFAKLGEYDMTIHTPEGLRLSVSPAPWETLRIILDRNHPGLDLFTLKLPAHSLKKLPPQWR